MVEFVPRKMMAEAAEVDGRIGDLTRATRVKLTLCQAAASLSWLLIKQGLV